MVTFKGESMISIAHRNMFLSQLQLSFSQSLWKIQRRVFYRNKFFPKGRMGDDLQAGFAYGILGRI
ncbi:MAG: hypothetical protein A2719_05265 [Candidatus Ryanbacteria bacterium RIFCSPHIGHO2_01_FULL_45_22]|uniref:Uncharacterized protein n=1 Tax=Candidatus Ryanbacteria bacterium RIFCSPHIGHO2_01_FULL_45_22 TaxID=1802114 RepID=A0A1G2G3D6_9BACT|nr:MAG: hypothetical protein A2719_05265 [Candidatus Ryanbacteria bacterium RIFCSPHIGHO2_01_FULL_45_22]